MWRSAKFANGLHGQFLLIQPQMQLMRRLISSRAEFHRVEDVNLRPALVLDPGPCPLETRVENIAQSVPKQVDTQDCHEDA